MQAQIYDIVNSAGGALVSPFVLAAALVAGATFATGLAGRVAIAVENLLYARTGRRRGY